MGKDAAENNGFTKIDSVLLWIFRLYNRSALSRKLDARVNLGCTNQ